MRAFDGFLVFQKAYDKVLSRIASQLIVLPPVTTRPPFGGAGQVINLPDLRTEEKKEELRVRATPKVQKIIGTCLALQVADLLVTLANGNGIGGSELMGDPFSRH